MSQLRFAYAPTPAIRRQGHRTDLAQQTILNSDCFSEMSAMQQESIDVVVTSPPYNIRLNYSEFKDDMPRVEYLAWLYDIARQVHRVLKPEGSFFLNIGGTNNDPWIPFEVAFQLRELFVLQNNITWVKSISVSEETFGHFKPINSERFLNNNHEQIFHFSKTGKVRIDRLSVGVPFKDKTNIARWGHSRDRRCAGNVWFIPYETVQSKNEKFNHPGTFPLELPVRCIRLHGKSGATVLDPFMGTGTTLIAAHQENCRGIGIDLDPMYCKIAIERLSEVVANG